MNNMKNIKTTCKYFFKYIFDSKKIYYFFLVLNIVFVSVAPFVNVIMPKYIINELMGKREVSKMALYVSILIVGNFLFAMGTKLVVEQRTKLEDWFSRSFDMLISEKTMGMKYENTEKAEVIEAEKKAERGLSWYSGGIRGLMDCIVAIVASIITLLGVVYIVFKVSIWLIVFAIIAVVVNAIVTAKCNQAQQEVFKITPAINKFYYYIYQKVTERKYAKEIRLYDAADVLCKKAKDNADTLNKIDNSCARKQTAWGILGAIISAISSGVSYCWLGLMAILGKITVADFVVCISALDVFTNQCLINIIRNVQDFGLKCNFMSAFVEYMQYEDVDKDTEKDLADFDFESIEFDNVSFTYPGTDNKILENVSFKVGKGESVSIVGLNGAGKSTIVKLICRLYTVDEGDIKINGKSIYDYDRESFVKNFSVVFQDFKLFGFSIDQNISFGDVEKEVDEKNIYKLSGIEEWVNKQQSNGDTLIGKEFDNNGVDPSGGIAQKIAIARALHRDSQLVILDEPTAALDPVAEYEIYNRFNELISGKTSFYISHRLSSCKFCDRIIVLDNKHIVEDGTHKELLDLDGFYAKMYKTQAQWYE